MKKPRTTQVVGTCAKCKQQELIISKGMCSACYNQEYHRKVRKHNIDRKHCVVCGRAINETGKITELCSECDFKYKMLAGRLQKTQENIEKTKFWLEILKKLDEGYTQAELTRLYELSRTTISNVYLQGKDYYQERLGFYENYLKELQQQQVVFETILNIERS